MKTALILDSDANQLQATSQLMKAAGWQVMTSASVQNALQRLEILPIDIVISEIQLADGDDISVLITAIRMLAADVKVIVYTQAVHILEGRKILESGVNAWLDKQRDFTRLAVVAGELAQEQIRKKHVETLWTAVYEQSTVFYLGNETPLALELVKWMLDECERFQIIEGNERNRVAVALEEALVNAIIHGNLEVSSRLRDLPGNEYETLINARRQESPYSQRIVRVAFSVSRQHAKFVICDEGPGFDVNSVPDPRAPDKVEIPSGRGLLLMRSFMDEVRYSARGNEVTLVKRVPVHRFSRPVPKREVSTSDSCELALELVLD